jgi:hypothetical protein
MERRAFVLYLGGAIVWPLAATAQQAIQIRHWGANAVRG